MGLLSIAIIIVIGIAILTVRKTKPRIRKKSVAPNNRALWIVLGYVGILIVAMVVYTFIPTLDGNGEANPIDIKYEQLQTALMTGQTAAVDPSLIVEKQNKKYEYKELNIGFANTNIESGSISIFIEKKAINDGKIECVLYKSLGEVNDLDITDQMKQPYLQWSKNTLNIIGPEKRVYKMVLPGNVSTVNQFKTMDHGFSTAFTSNKLYLKVPRDLKIINNSGEKFNIEYIKP